MPLINIGNYEEAYGRSIQLPKCNREACTSIFAPCYNRGTNTYYCYECARDMNKFPAWDGEPLCEIPERNVLHEMEALCFDGKLYVGTQKLEDIPSLWNDAKTRMPKDDKQNFPDFFVPSGGYRKGELMIFGSKYGK